MRVSIENLKKEENSKSLSNEAHVALKIPLYSFKYSYQVLIICAQICGFKYSCLIQIIFTQLYVIT